MLGVGLSATFFSDANESLFKLCYESVPLQKILLYTLKTLVQMKHEDNLVLNKLIALDVA